MALTPFSGTISATTYDANFDDKTSTLTTNAKAGSRDWQVDVAATNLTTTAIFVEFTPRETLLLRSLGISVYDTANGLIATATLTSPDNDDYQVGATWSVAATTVAATRLDARTSYLADATPKLRLKAGVRWKLSIVATSGTIDRVYAYAHVRSLRRRA